MSQTYVHPTTRPLKNIIFDLGGVLLDVDYNASINAFVDLGGEDFHRVFSQKEQKDLFDKFDTGIILPEKFRNGIRELISNNISNEQIDNAWNAMLGEYRKESVKFLKELKKSYRLFLLSNTNAIHFPHIDNAIKKIGYDSISQLLEKDYYSHLIHARKPDAEAFLYVLGDSGLNA
ncbi:MAG: hypothetical protein LBH34_00190, partial [Prevotellaceae bacterium]|nr:hypothetical protein [Prevotellaceae bacterium]